MQYTKLVFTLICSVLLSSCSGSNSEMPLDRALAMISQHGPASWYGGSFNGRKTANGERYNMFEMTAAHRYLPFGSRIVVTNLSTGKAITVRINDRGPYHGDRIIDLSYAAAVKLGMDQKGVQQVSLRVE